MSMIINVFRDDLYESVASLQNVTNKKGTVAILSNILLETSQESIVLTATDLQVGIKVEVSVEVLSPGTITLPSRKLFEITRETVDDHIRIEVSENNWVKISTKSGSYNLAGTDAEEFPSFPEFDQEILATIPCDVIKETIDKTIFSVAQEGESQFNLNGAQFEKETKEDNKNYIRLISSDGHRLSLMEREVDTDISRLNLEKTILIPRKGLQEIKKFCENNDFIELGFDSKQAVIKTDKALMIIRLMNGDFPNYKKIIQAINRDNFIEIKRLDFISALKRINLFTEDLYGSVQFCFSENKMTLTSQNMDIGSAKEELNISYSGEVLNLGFNGKYFVEALQVMSSENIKAFIKSENSPCLLEGEEDPGFMGIIMPMKL